MAIKDQVVSVTATASYQITGQIVSRRLQSGIAEPTGFVLAWGKNDYGQLGLGVKEPIASWTTWRISRR